MAVNFKLELVLTDRNVGQNNNQNWSVVLMFSPKITIRQLQSREKLTQEKSKGFKEQLKDREQKLNHK